MKYYKVGTIQDGLHVLETEKQFDNPSAFYRSVGYCAENLPLSFIDYNSKDYVFWIEFKLDEETHDGVAFFIVDERKKKV